MKLTFRHRFTDGRRAMMTLRGPNAAPRVRWPDGMPALETVRGEYLQWMQTAMQEAANRYGRRMLYVMPDGAQMHTATFEPQEAL